MLLKSSIYPWSGYAGYMKQPHLIKYSTSLFLVTNQNRDELNIFLTQPGSYDTAYHIAKGTHFHDINIFATSADINFVSDLYRLAHDLKMLGKPVVHTIFPEKIQIPTDTMFRLNHLQLFTFNSNYDKNIAVEYRISDRSLEDRVQSGEEELPNFTIYDMIVYLGNKVVILPAKLTVETLEEYSKMKKVEIHLPYSSTLYGGISYKDIEINQDKLFDHRTHRILRVNCFGSYDEYLYCKNNGSILIADPLKKSLL